MSKLLKPRKEAVILLRKFASNLAQAAQLLKSRKALVQLVLVVLVFNMFIAVSVAWFSMNRKTDVDEMGMGLAVDDTSAVYKAYMFDLHAMEGTNLSSDGTELDITNIDLNQYDTIFSVQNKYTPAFAQIRIAGSAAMLELENGTIYITITREELEAQAGGLAMVSSSVVRFTAFIDSTKQDLAQQTADELYRYINDEKRFEAVSGCETNESDSKTFVTVIGEGAGHTHDKVDTIILAVPFSSDDWYPDEEGHQTLNVYLYMTYDVKLIECFMAEQTDGKISLDDNIYFFENDLKKISVSYAK